MYTIIYIMSDQTVLIFLVQACYRDEELVYRALKEYSELTRKMPIHVIFGDTPDIRQVFSPWLSAVVPDHMENVVLENFRMFILIQNWVATPLPSRMFKTSDTWLFNRRLMPRRTQSSKFSRMYQRQQRRRQLFEYVQYS